jgi:hypothetical protein
VHQGCMKFLNLDPKDQLCTTCLIRNDHCPKGAMECIICHQTHGLLLMLKQGSFIHAFCAFHSLTCAPRGTGPLTLQSYRPSLTLKQVKDANQIRHHGGGFCGKKFGAVTGEVELAEILQTENVLTLVDDPTLSLSNMTTF